MPKTKKKVVRLIECQYCDSFDAETWDLVQAHIDLVHATVYAKASRGDYTTKVHYARRDVNDVIYVAYHADQVRLNKQFKLDLEAEHCVTDNPKRDRLFDLAWSQGHSSGYAEVASCYGELVELIKE
jgi:hypothetical protein